jgi:DNA N-6-adenine-methyltransferase (Dam)
MVAYRKRNAKKRYAKPPCDDEWFTPRDVIKAARATLGAIDIDPASHPHPQSWIRARTFYTKADDGLSRPWKGRVFLNPPYSRDLLGRFVAKLLAELKAGNVSAAVLLTNTSSASAWYHDALAACSALCTPRGRVRFERTDEVRTSPRHDSTLFYFGKDVAAFRAAFEPLGAVMVTGSRTSWNSVS